MCVGKRLAELEIEALIIKLIRNYKVEWHHEDMKMKGNILNVPASDLKFKITQV